MENDLREYLDKLSADIADIRGTMATKDDIEAVRADMATKAELAEVRATMATKEDLAEARADLKKDISNLDKKLSKKMSLISSPA